MDLRKSVQRIRRSIAAIVAFFCICALSACGGASDNPGYKVVIIAGEGYTVEGANPVYVKRGQNLSADISIDDGYIFVGTDRGEFLDGKRLVVPNVRYGFSVNFLVRKIGESERVLTIDPNGGKYEKQIYKAAAETNGTVYLPQEVTATPRENGGEGVAAADTTVPIREDHTLSGFAENADGSGERYGLGAMFCVPDTDAVLYAVWEAWTGADYLEFAAADGALGGGGVHPSRVE